MTANSARVMANRDLRLDRDQCLQVIPKPAFGAGIQAGTGGDSGPAAPGDAGAVEFKLANQLHVFVAGQWREATRPEVGRSADSQVRTMDMSMTVPMLVVLLVADLRVQRDAVMPVPRGHGAAHRIRVQRQLFYQPVVCHGTVAVGAGDPAGALFKQKARPGRPGNAHITNRDLKGHDAQSLGYPG